MRNGLLSVLFLLVGIVAAQAQQDTTFKSYLGRYTFVDGSVVPFVDIVGDSLKAMMMNSEAGVSPMEFVAVDKFNITNFNGTADFKRDSTRQVISIHIEAMGYVLDGMKEKGTAAWNWKMYYTDEHIYAVLKK